MAKENTQHGNSSSSKTANQTAADHRANVLNGNKGTPGQNITRAKNQGNRGKQLNQKRKP